MLTVTKEFVFDAAHMLAGHEGLCKNVHGHTNKVEVEVKFETMWKDNLRDSGSAEGMVVDFKKLKESLNEKLFDYLDHAFIFNRMSDSLIESRLTDTMADLGLKIYPMPNRPTAENMSVHFYEKIEVILNDVPELTDVHLVSVTVYETPTSKATFRR